MQEHDLSFVRMEMVNAQAAPAGERGLGRWLRTNFFASIPDTIMTVLAALLILWFVPPLLDWLFLSAAWTGADRSVCATVAQGGAQPEGWSGACWAFVNAKFEQFVFGQYPISERWRVLLVFAMFVVLLVPLMIPSAPRKGLNAALFFGALPVLAFFLLVGSALPFALVGFVAFLVQMAILAVGAVLSLIFVVPVFLLVVLGYLGGLLGASDTFDDPIALFFAELAVRVSRLFEFLAGLIGSARSDLEAMLGAVPSFWADFAVSSAAVLALVLYLGRGRRSMLLVTAALALTALLIRWIGLDVGLPLVRTSLWGGLMVTLVLSFVGIAVSLPFGILLALGRRSNLPVVKLVCVIFIETIRGVPLIVVLFMASVMLPLFLPPGTTFDRFLRALVGVAMFASAYMAEVVRGGLQAIPKGQYEGADSLGLNYWQKTGLIVLPQALKLVIPGIVNTFIGLFKDTSLVYIIGMFDLLGIVRQNFSDVNWASPQTPMTGLVFAGFVFWLFCFGMSRYSQFMERRLDTGHRR